LLQLGFVEIGLQGSPDRNTVLITVGEEQPDGIFFGIPFRSAELVSKPGSHGLFHIQRVHRESGKLDFLAIDHSFRIVGVDHLQIDQIRSDFGTELEFGLEFGDGRNLEIAHYLTFGGCDRSHYRRGGCLGAIVANPAKLPTAAAQREFQLLVIRHELAFCEFGYRLLSVLIFITGHVEGGEDSAIYCIGIVFQRIDEVVVDLAPDIGLDVGIILVWPDLVSLLEEPVDLAVDYSDRVFVDAAFESEGPHYSWSIQLELVGGRDKPLHLCHFGIHGVDEGGQQF